MYDEKLTLLNLISSTNKLLEFALGDEKSGRASDLQRTYISRLDHQEVLEKELKKQEAQFQEELGQIYLEIEETKSLWMEMLQNSNQNPLVTKITEEVKSTDKIVSPKIPIPSQPKEVVLENTKPRTNTIKNAKDDPSTGKLQRLRLLLEDLRDGN
eukprot:TRINITY_DN14112_c0_g4_i1.p1 TRINITY_DN14112_c0_g4~~TRINITY_DN14112_c0_g4_i1.p1  ORF type:complete len:156 (+),score=24.46 TRINITY_DN14112_c0_g4_i1:694-1161(+)